MEDSLTIVFSLIIALIIMFIVPLVDIWEIQDNLAFVVVYSATTDFVDIVRNTGYISKDNYSNFVLLLNSTGNRYDITMEHKAYNSRIASKMKSGDDSYETPYLITYTSMISDYLNKGHIYRLNKYDSFYVTVRNTNKTQASVVNSIIARDNTNFKIGCAYGGVIWARRDEN